MTTGRITRQTRRMKLSRFQLQPYHLSMHLMISFIVLISFCFSIGQFSDLPRSVWLLVKPESCIDEVFLFFEEYLIIYSLRSFFQPLANDREVVVDELFFLELLEFQREAQLTGFDGRNQSVDGLNPCFFHVFHLLSVPF